jgi:Lrp/AsnC family transcriptional regulator for asnA, asnC and gidA
MSRNKKDTQGGADDILDDLDREVIAALQRDGRRSYSNLGNELGVAESVVRYRVQRLEKSGILQIVGIADPLKVGFDLMALVGIGVQPGVLPAVSNAMAQLPEASYVAAVAGRFDLMVEVVCRDTAHFSTLLTEQIQCVPGVLRTEAFLILSIQKMAYGWDVRKNVGPQTGPPAGPAVSG